jgi:hypothetical protein
MSALSGTFEVLALVVEVFGCAFAGASRGCFAVVFALVVLAVVAFVYVVVVAGAFVLRGAGFVVVGSSVVIGLPLSSLARIALDPNDRHCITTCQGQNADDGWEGSATPVVQNAR